MQNIKENSKYNILPWEDVLNGENHTIVGNIKVINNFYIPQLNRSRRIWIYLPNDYEDSINRYPVLYMHDGQTVFDKQTNPLNKEWKVDEVLDKLFKEGKTKGVIVVAIDSDFKFRREEYNPVKVSPEGVIPKTDAYAEFIVKTLKPFIDSNFRTKSERDYTGIAGLSAGAICSIYIGLKYQDIFSKIGAFSFTMLKSIAIMPNILKDTFSKKNPMKIYMDVGRKESKDLPSEIKEYFVADLVHELKAFYTFLISVGFNENELMLIIDDNGTHSISSVAGRFPNAFLWLFHCTDSSK
jgi:predicted alpha/beta superfamily hydrolase